MRYSSREPETIPWFLTDYDMAKAALAWPRLHKFILSCAQYVSDSSRRTEVLLTHNSTYTVPFRDQRAIPEVPYRGPGARLLWRQMEPLSRIWPSTPHLLSDGFHCSYVKAVQDAAVEYMTKWYSDWKKSA